MDVILCFHYLSFILFFFFFFLAASCSLQDLSSLTRNFHSSESTESLPLRLPENSLKFYVLKKKKKGSSFSVFSMLLAFMHSYSPHFEERSIFAFLLCFFFLLRYSSHTIKYTQGFPVGPMTKNPPASAGEMGSFPGPGRFHMLRGS